MPPGLRIPATALLLACLAGPALGEGPEFLRLTRDDRDQPVSLDTAVVSYAETAAGARRAGRRVPVQVDLVAAVHVGGRDYYEALNRAFAAYDAVLYELVAPPKARVPKPGRKPAGALGAAQQGLTRMLGLDFQLDRVDYGAANFVHADLSPREFDAAMAKRGETWLGVFTRLMNEASTRAGDGAAEVSLGDLFGLVFSAEADRQVRLRRIMAEQFSDMDVLVAAFGGEKGSTLITDRNTAALAVLRNRIARGDARIAIFYGAAHMPDFDARLRDDFGLQPRDTAWLEAWDLRDPEPAASRR